MEPSVGTDRLAAELQQEVAIAVGAEGQSNVHEVYVVLAAVIRRADSMPDSEYLGMDDRMRLLPRRYKPQIGVVARIDDGASSYNLLTLDGYINASVAVLGKRKEELHRRNVAVQLEPIIILQHLVKGAYLFLIVGLTGYYSGAVALVYRPDGLFRQAFLGAQAMQGVMDVHPRYREEGMLPECLISEHF